MANYSRWEDIKNRKGAPYLAQPFGAPCSRITTQTVLKASKPCVRLVSRHTPAR